MGDFSCFQCVKWSNYLLCSYCVLAVYLHSTVYLQCTYSVLTMYLQCTYVLQCTYSVFTVYLQFTYMNTYITYSVLKQDLSKLSRDIYNDLPHLRAIRCVISFSDHNSNTYIMLKISVLSILTRKWAQRSSLNYG